MLDDFEGDEVVGAKIEIRGVGGGLNEALQFEEWQGRGHETIRVVMDLEITNLRFDPAKEDEGAWVRVHIARLVDGRIARAAGDFDRACQAYLNGHQEAVADARQQRLELEAQEAERDAQQALRDTEERLAAQEAAEDGRAEPIEQEAGLRAVAG